MGKLVASEPERRVAFRDFADFADFRGLSAFVVFVWFAFRLFGDVVRADADAFRTLGGPVFFTYETL